MLSRLPTPFWERLASLGNETTTALRSDALRVATVAAGYIYNKLFKEAHQYPWRLAVGNVKANLQTLMEAVSAQDPVACKFKQLLHPGFNREALENAIMLFCEVPWTTTTVEQRAWIGCHHPPAPYQVRH